MIESYYHKLSPDPALEVFKARGYAQSDETTHQLSTLATLSPFLRTLLLTDGTVTRSLEAFFWEPVDIEQHTLETITSSQTLPWLGVQADEELLIREVTLVGQHSRQTYTSAYSLVRLQQIPKSLRQQLVDGGIGIGVLLSQFDVESYRELLEVGYCENMKFDGDFSTHSTKSDFIYRSYRIKLGQEPAVLITEKFPTHLYPA